MFIADLSTRAYFVHGERVRAIGWLEGHEPFVRGPVSVAFLAVLKAHVAAAHQVVLFRGLHSCSLCPDGLRAYDRERAGYRNLLIPTGGLLYVAPELIAHYVEHHGYRPPEEFVAAVRACSAQGSEEYLRLLLPFEHCWQRE